MDSTSCRILLVEDHDDTARALTRLLSLSGYDVHTADSFASALQLFDEHTFDLLISDVGLPDGSGYELMRQAISRHCGSGTMGCSESATQSQPRPTSSGFVSAIGFAISSRRAALRTWMTSAPVSRPMRPRGAPR